jgi:hypothetical protein
MLILYELVLSEVFCNLYYLLLRRMSIKAINSQTRITIKQTTNTIMDSHFTNLFHVDVTIADYPCSVIPVHQTSLATECILLLIPGEKFQLRFTNYSTVPGVVSGKINNRLVVQNQEGSNKMAVPSKHTVVMKGYITDDTMEPFCFESDTSGMIEITVCKAEYEETKSNSNNSSAKYDVSLMKVHQNPSKTIKIHYMDRQLFVTKMKEYSIHPSVLIEQEKMYLTHYRLTTICPNIEKWTVDQVAFFIKNILKIPQYEKNFKEHSINGKCLLSLTAEQMLKHLNINNYGVCYSIESAVAKLSNGFNNK